MLLLNSEEIRLLAPMPQLIESLRSAFQSECIVPPRQVTSMPGGIGDRLRSRIFVDTFEGALCEAGDILDPLERGTIERQRIEGELADLVSGRVRGRRGDDEIILFKSVGTAIEDLAASQLIFAAATARRP